MKKTKNDPNVASLKRDDDGNDDDEAMKVCKHENDPEETRSSTIKRGASRELVSPTAKRARNDPLVEALMQRIRNYFSDTDPTEAPIDAEKSRHLLEASSGNVELAAGFYWDEYFASTAVHRKKRSSPKDPPTQRRKFEEAPPQPQAQAQAQAQAQEPRDCMENEDDEDEDDAPAIQNVPIDNNEAAAAAAILEAGGGDDHPADQVAGSVSVSDDEAASSGGVWRLMARRRRIDGDTGIGRSMRVDSNVLSRAVSDRVEQEKSSGAQKRAADDGVGDDDNLSDDEWLLGTQGSPASQQPSRLLWGLKRTVADSASVDGPNNVVDEDDDDEDSQPRLVPTIPRTWLHAGFSMPPCGTGLILKGPTDEDVLNYKWRLSQLDGGSHSRHVVLPPYHCKSVTAVLSVVTAVMYSGASIQGEKVNCGSSRKPFAELTEAQRKKEFDLRFADALSALLFVAFKASSERKRRALMKRNTLNATRSEVDKLRTQSIQRRLKLVPTCRWPTDTTGDLELPEGRDSRNVGILTSYTNVHDLRNYVLSNMRSFTGRGGCALFLETILRIHGKTTVERMVKRSRGEGPPFLLINCTCEERHKEEQATNANVVPTKNELDTTPPGCQCLSIELLSLLLTGQVSSTISGMANQLGVGILSSSSTGVGTQLKQKDESVWILRGDTCHSILWLSNKKDLEVVDRPGEVVEFEHWNCWYDQKNKSRFRMKTERRPWAPPTQTRKTNDSTRKRTVIEAIVERRRQKRGQEANVVSCDENDGGTAVKEVTKEELASVREHPEDRHFYPNQYSRWRYDLSGDGTWRSFHLLDKRQQLVVETKLAPRINHILRTRWPKASMDHQNNESPIV